MNVTQSVNRECNIMVEKKITVGNLACNTEYILHFFYCKNSVERYGLHTNPCISK